MTPTGTRKIESQCLCGFAGRASDRVSSGLNGKGRAATTINSAVSWIFPGHYDGNTVYHIQHGDS